MQIPEGELVDTVDTVEPPSAEPILLLQKMEERVLSGTISTLGTY